MASTPFGRADHGPVRLAWAPIDDAAQRSEQGGRLLAALLTELGEDDQRIEHACATCGSAEHGRPVMPSGRVVVSLAYADGLAVAAAARAEDAAAVGVDAEHGAAGEPLHELAALFAPAAPPDLRGWTVIEAAVKADGRGLRIPPDQVRGTGIRGSVLPGAEFVRLPDGRMLEVAAAAAPPGYVISVAIDPVPGSDR